MKSQHECVCVCVKEQQLYINVFGPAFRYAYFSTNMQKPECQYLVFMIQHPQMADVVCSPVCLQNVR